MYRIFFTEQNISDLRREEEDEIDSYGAYEYNKELFVEDLDGNRRGVNGHIIQRIMKETNVKWVRRDAAGRLGREETLTTSAQIATKTNNHVQYMSQSYFEIFEIKNGKYQRFSDSFQNGAIVEYDNSGNPIVDDNFLTPDTAFSKGNIVQTGLSVFFPANDPKFETIRAQPGWTKSRDTPANGLWYIPYSDAVNAMVFAEPKSNLVEHQVTVTWDYPAAGEGGHSHESVIVSTTRDVARGGTRKHRRTRRRRRTAY